MFLFVCCSCCCFVVVVVVVVVAVVCTSLRDQLFLNLCVMFAFVFFSFMLVYRLVLWIDFRKG